jgi:hypothetical protein
MRSLAGAFRLSFHLEHIPHRPELGQDGGATIYLYFFFLLSYFLLYCYSTFIYNTILLYLDSVYFTYILLILYRFESQVETGTAPRFLPHRWYIFRVSNGLR